MGLGTSGPSGAYNSFPAQAKQAPPLPSGPMFDAQAGKNLGGGAMKAALAGRQGARPMSSSAPALPPPRTPAGGATISGGVNSGVPPNMVSPDQYNPYQKSSSSGVPGATIASSPMQRGPGPESTPGSAPGYWQKDDSYQYATKDQNMPDDWRRATRLYDPNTGADLGGRFQAWTSPSDPNQRMFSGYVPGATGPTTGSGILSSDFEDPVARLNREWRMWNSIHPGTDQSGPGGGRS